MIDEIGPKEYGIPTKIVDNHFRTEEVYLNAQHIGVMYVGLPISMTNGNCKSLWHTCAKDIH